MRRDVYNVPSKLNKTVWLSCSEFLLGGTACQVLLKAVLRTDEGQCLQSLAVCHPEEYTSVSSETGSTPESSIVTFAERPATKLRNVQHSSEKRVKKKKREDIKGAVLPAVNETSPCHPEAGRKGGMQPGPRHYIG